MTIPRFPHPLVLLVGCVLLAAAATWVAPAGEYDRTLDDASGREVVVSGTFHPVESNPVGLWGALIAIPQGMLDAGLVIFFVFLVGGSFTVVERTGALRSGIVWLLAACRGNRDLIVVAMCLVFATGGILYNAQEEIIALMPVMLLLARSLGYDPLLAAGMSLGAAAVGSSFSPMNPFQAGLAQKVAGLPLLSGWQYRSIFMAIAVAAFTWLIVRRARTQTIGASGGAIDLGSEDTAGDWRHGVILAIFVAAFGVFLYGVMALGWDFDRMAALFFGVGIVAGLIGGLKIDGTATAYLEGFRAMTGAAIMIGVARAIFVVLEQGRIVDTLVHALFTPLEHVPLAISALGMMLAHQLIHVPVSSVSGQAVLTMPVAVPLTDLLDMSPQVAVLAYQYGAGMMDMVTPTNGSMMAVIAAAGVRYEDWLQFVLVPFLLLSALGALAVLIAATTAVF